MRRNIIISVSSLAAGVAVALAQGAAAPQAVTLDNLSEPLKWILGILTTVVVGGGSFFLTALYRQIGELGRNHEAGMNKIREDVDVKLDRILAQLASSKEDLVRGEERFKAMDLRLQMTELRSVRAETVAQRAHSRLDRLGAPHASGERSEDSA